MHTTNIGYEGGHARRAIRAAGGDKYEIVANVVRNEQAFRNDHNSSAQIQLPQK